MEINSRFGNVVLQNVDTVNEEVSMSINKSLLIEMVDGSLWTVSADFIAQHRAEYFKDEFDGDIERSLSEDTVPLFDYDDWEIVNWARYHMHWEDIEGSAIKLEGSKIDYNNGWRNSHMEVRWG